MYVNIIFRYLLWGLSKLSTGLPPPWQSNRGNTYRVVSILLDVFSTFEPANLTRARTNKYVFEYRSAQKKVL